MKKLKILTLLFSTISLSILFSSCDKLNGDGDNVIQTLSLVDTFISININIPCSISIEYSEKEEVSIEAQENIIENLYWTIENNSLYIEFTRPINDYNPITITLKMPEFRDIILNDENNLTVDSLFKMDTRIRIELNKTGFITFNDSIYCYDFFYSDSKTSSFKANYLCCSRNFQLENNGYTDVSINGSCKNATIIVNKMLNFEGFDFITNKTKLSVTGNSETTHLFVKEELEAIVSGSAYIRYKGTPDSIITSESTGEIDIEAIE